MCESESSIVGEGHTEGLVILRPIGRVLGQRIDPVVSSLGGGDGTQRRHITSFEPSCLSFSASISSWTAHHASEYGRKVPSTLSRSRLGSRSAGVRFVRRRFVTTGRFGFWPRPSHAIGRRSCAVDAVHPASAAQKVSKIKPCRIMPGL